MRMSSATAKRLVIVPEVCDHCHERGQLYIEWDERAFEVDVVCRVCGLRVSATGRRSPAIRYGERR